MYLKSIHIKNIRGIEDFKMEFQDGKEAGWHVLLGANGSGKTTVLRAIALALIGPTEILRLDPNWEHWARKSSTDKSEIRFEIFSHFDVIEEAYPNGRMLHGNGILEFQRKNGHWGLQGNYKDSNNIFEDNHIWANYVLEFSAGFGAFRRFSGGNQQLENFYSHPLIGSYLTLFKDEAALTETKIWLKDQLTRANSGSKEQRDQASLVLDRVKHFINDGGLLPDGYAFFEVTADGVLFHDGNECFLPIEELSEGIKSALCLALELFRLLIARDSFDSLHLEIEQGKFLTLDTIVSFGIVLIDEPDAHLHPDWQARIGTWFRKVFPNIQFIVATHSPLVVRAAGDDSQIWWLPAAGSEEKARLIENGERNRLVYGDVLDAFGTEIFGKQDERSEKGKELMHELSQLGTSLIFGKLDEKGIARMAELKSMLSL